MKLDEFKNNLIEGLKLNNINNINITDYKIELLYKYMNYIIEKNKSINLTTIIDKYEFIYKHYIDSIYISKYIKEGKLLDIGTGAGFPGMPLLILIDNLEVTFLDSKNKKLKIIEEFVKENNIKNAKFLHVRAERTDENKIYLNKYDYVTTRAVSNIENVINYSIPYLKAEGKGIAMRGILTEEEKNIIQNNNFIDNIEIYSIIDSIQKTEYQRSVLILKKTR